MNQRDPILNHIGVAMNRLVLFIVLSLIQALVLWLWLLLGEFHVAASDLLLWVREAWTPVGNKLPAVIACGCMSIGVLNSTVLYLVVGRWWNKRADVRRYRGARLEDGGM